MSTQPDSKTARAALIDALKHGRIAEAQELRSQGARVAPQGAIAGLILAAYEKATTHRIYSAQLDPDQLTTIVSFKEVADLCGPFYRTEPCLGMDPRPAGWARVASEDRVLSVYNEFGLGLAADQALGEPVRYVSTKPLTRFRHAVVAGPFTAPTQPTPAHLAAPNWERLGVSPDSVDMPAFKRLLFEYVRLGHDVQWTHQFGRLQELEEVVGELVSAWSSLNPDPELYLAVALLQGSTRDTVICLNQAVERDATLSQLACLILFHRTVEKMALEHETAPAQLSRDFPRASPDDQEWSTAVAMSAMQLLLLQEEGGAVNLADILAFTKYIGHRERAYESVMIENSCRAIAEKVWHDHRKVSAEFGGNPHLYAQAFKLGYKPSLAWAMAKASQPGFTPLLAYLLLQGVSPRGCLTHVGNFSEVTEARQKDPSARPETRPGYFVPLAHAVNEHAEDTVRMLLDYGADPHEPSHLHGKTALELATSPTIKQLLIARAGQPLQQTFNPQVWV